MDQVINGLIGSSPAAVAVIVTVFLFLKDRKDLREEHARNNAILEDIARRIIDCTAKISNIASRLEGVLLRIEKNGKTHHNED